ncbi:DUF1566 domain-containing protein [Comamonas thiooxydans]|uniref:Lcl C-terminal domain-containing protein n=1 Tax=Comamonas thiooxydans TaxID=363952 RepID=UPI0001BB12F5|nr:DUF1566 domain-containing protein [Comamonas thiooxydans]ACY33446.1 hypothetical conserved protein [Comamonas thiooxydans]UUE95425.1 DUF1566 domain-containing protein [Comamonas thiooxydans]
MAAGPTGAQPAPAAPAFQLSPDASMVIDTRARLAWPRCAEGMSWNGKACGGQAEVFSYKQAMSHAAERSKAENLRWRLPRVNELKRLLDRSSKPQGLNPELFPNAPRDWHWTGTAAVNAQRLNTYNYAQVDKSSSLSGLSAQQAWAVNTETLQAVPDMGKGNALLLRLVRPATEAELGTQAPAAP